jgi:hypothetical protein
MRGCRAGILIVLAAVLAAPAAWAQEPATPTPPPTESPTATPPPEPTPTPEEIEEAKRKERLRKRKIVRSVYADYRRDGRIDNCDHSRTALKRTLESISDTFDTDFPDFREAVKAAIKDRDKERCEEEKAAAEATPTPTATPTPAPTSPPPAATTAPPTSTDSGDLDFDSGAAGGSGGGRNGGGSSPAPETTPPTESDVAPVQPQGTPTPTAVPPTTEPQLAVVRPDGDSNLLVPALLLAAALAGLGLLGASALAARRDGRLAGWGHSLREASYRAGGAWGDFGDWLRLGR